MVSIVDDEPLTETSREAGRLAPDDDPEDEGDTLENFHVSHASCSSLNGDRSQGKEGENKKQKKNQLNRTLHFLVGPVLS